MTHDYNPEFLKWDSGWIAGQKKIAAGMANGAGAEAHA